MLFTPCSVMTYYIAFLTPKSEEASYGSFLISICTKDLTYSNCQEAFLLSGALYFDYFEYLFITEIN